jgi:hypothetical protein
VRQQQKSVTAATVLLSSNEKTSGHGFFAVYSAHVCNMHMFQFTVHALRRHCSSPHVLEVPSRRSL